MEHEDEYRSKYAVVIRGAGGLMRGFTVVAESRADAWRKMLDKVDMNCVNDLYIGEILLEEDEF